MESLTFGSLAGSVTTFWLLAGAAVVIGIVVWLLCSYPTKTIPAFRTWRVFRLLGLAVAVSSAFIIVCLAYLSLWTVFYRVEVEQDELLVRYFMPKRTARIPRTAVEEIKLSETGDECRLVIRTRTGRVYRSAAVSRVTYEQHIEVLKRLGF